MSGDEFLIMKKGTSNLDLVELDFASAAIKVLPIPVFMVDLEEVKYNIFFANDTFAKAIGVASAETLNGRHVGSYSIRSSRMGARRRIS